MTTLGREKDDTLDPVLTWVGRWHNDLARMDKEEARQDYLKRVYSMATSPYFSYGVNIFLWTRLQQDPATAKQHLEILAQDKNYLARTSAETRAMLCVSYHHALYHYTTKTSSSLQEPAQKHLLGKTESDAMISYLSAQDYGGAMKGKVMAQSGVIARLADILQFDAKVNEHNWRSSPVEAREDYLTKLSRASDYTLTKVTYAAHAKENIYQKNSIPHNSAVFLVQFDDENKYGEYGNTADHINITRDHDFVNAITTLQHEKAHQLSRMEYKKCESGSVHTAQYMLQLFQTSILDLFEKFASQDDHYKVYMVQPEERLARFAEIFNSVTVLDTGIRRQYGVQLQKIFADAPPQFDYVKNALTTFHQHLDAQDNNSLSPKYFF